MGATESKEQPTDPKILDKPWREIDWSQRDALLNHLKEYKPGASVLRVLLYGSVGAGKSSFINTVASILLGRTANVASVESSTTSDESFTITYKTHKIRNAENKIIPIVFNDIMGLESNTGVRPDDIKLAMKGHVKDGYVFDPKNTLSPENEKFNPNPTLEDKVHVLVCLLNANVTDITQETLKKMREVKEVARDLGIPQMAIATHIDELSEEIEKNVRNVYRDTVLKKKIEYFSSKVGIPEHHTFLVRNNYEMPNNDLDTLFLTSLKTMLGFGDDFFFEHND